MTDRKQTSQALVALLIGLALVAHLSSATQLNFDVAKMPTGSCAISCPSETPHAGLKAAVTCQAGFVPVCQCVEEPSMAFCEPL